MILISGLGCMGVRMILVWGGCKLKRLQRLSRLLQFYRIACIQKLRIIRDDQLLHICCHYASIICHSAPLLFLTHCQFIKTNNFYMRQLQCTSSIRMATRFLSTLKPQKNKKKRQELDPKETQAFLSRPVKKLEDLNRKLRKSYEKDFFNKPQFEHFKILKDKRLNKDNDSVTSQENNNDSDFEVNENPARPKPRRNVRRDNSSESEQIEKKRKPGRPSRAKNLNSNKTLEKTDMTAGIVRKHQKQNENSIVNHEKDKLNGVGRQKAELSRWAVRSKPNPPREKSKSSEGTSQSESQQSSDSQESSESGREQSQHTEKKTPEKQKENQKSDESLSEEMQEDQKQKPALNQNQKLQKTKPHNENSQVNHNSLKANKQNQQIAEINQSQSEQYYKPSKQEGQIQESRQKQQNKQIVQPQIVAPSKQAEIYADEQSETSQRSLSSEESSQSLLKQRIAEAEAQKQKMMEKGGKKCTRVYRNNNNSSSSAQNKSLSPTPNPAINSNIAKNQNLQTKQPFNTPQIVDSSVEPQIQEQRKEDPPIQKNLQKEVSLKRSHQQYITTNVKPKLQIKSRNLSQCFMAAQERKGQFKSLKESHEQQHSQSHRQELKKDKQQAVNHKIDHLPAQNSRSENLSQNGIIQRSLIK